MELPTRYLLGCIETMPYHPSKNEMASIKTLLQSIIMVPYSKTEYRHFYLNNPIPLDNKEKLKTWLFHLHNAGLPTFKRCSDLIHFDKLYSTSYETPSYMIYVFIVVVLIWLYWVFNRKYDSEVTGGGDLKPKNIDYISMNDGIQVN